MSGAHKMAAVNSFRQHIPPFVEVDRRPAPIPFTTVDELLALEVVQRCKDEAFSHFALSDNALMAVSDDGYKWWVVGFIAQPEQVDLPTWKPRYLARLPDGRDVSLDGGEVASSGGGKLWLRDGTVAVDLKY